MSLRVWLPLTKDLRNQGLDDIAVTNSGATFDSVGKLGGCYSFDGADDAITVGNLSTLVTDKFSFACWFYHDDTWSSKNYETIFGGPSGFELETKSGSTNSPVIRAYSWGQGTFTYELNKWNHLVMTRTTSETKFYLNGELKLTGAAGTIPSGNYFVGSWSTTTGQNFKGKVNDVRIYDHCLSPMEVKQLSQGLVLHYPLNNMGFGQENLAHNTYGLKPFSTSQVEFKAYDVGLLDVSNGEQITISFDLDMTVATGGSGFLQIYNTNYPGPHQITTGNALAGRTLVTGQDIHERISYTTTMTTRSSSSYSTDRIEFYSNYSTENEIQISNIKIERGNKATPWCPNSSDELASTLGLNSTTEYDCSGFCNNGVKTGTFSLTSDTPKYNVSTQFNGTQRIQAPFSCGTISEAVSVAVWGYESNWNTSSAERLMGAATNSSGWCIGDYGSENTLFAFYANGSYNAATGFKQLSAGWHHFVITFDGLHLNYYVDGQSFSSKTFSTKQTATGNYNIEIGRHYGGGYNFKGCMSDVRIYATALSADDVKSLYQNSAYIDSSGNIYGTIYEP